MRGRQGEEETGNEERGKEAEERQFCIQQSRFIFQVNPDIEARNSRGIHAGWGLGPALPTAWFLVWEMKLL